MNSYFVSLGDREYAIEFGPDGNVLMDSKCGAMNVRQLDERTFSVLLGEKSYKIVCEQADGVYQLFINGKQLDATVESERARLLKRFDSQRSSLQTRAEIKAPMPALVVKLEVAIGDVVKPGQGLLVLEAMKMENEIKAHSAGTVREIFVSKGMPVEKGARLMVLE